jgi:predicted GNAT family acetyltransferase
MDLLYENNRIYLNNTHGKVIGEVTFSQLSQEIVNIEHTYVDPSFRGQGIADKLLRALAVKLRQEGKRAYPTCSYAIKWFEANPAESDLLSKAPDTWQS